MKTKYLPVRQGYRVRENFPNFHRSGSIRGMKAKFYGADALLVRCGEWIYNVTSRPSIYHEHAR
jgi:hypothetical protein